MVELIVTKTVNTEHFGPIEPGCVLVVPDHLARRLVGAGYAELRIAGDGECTGDCVDIGDGGIVAEFADETED